MIKKTVLILFILFGAGLTIIFYLWHKKHSGSLERGTIVVNNIVREFYYYAPAGISKNPKLVFVIHGSTGTPKAMQVITGHEFDTLAGQNKDAIIVYPAGYHGYWNDCRKLGTYDSKLLNIDDVLFFEKMIAYFKQIYNIDTTEIFAVGHSNGGQMCFKLAKEKPHWFRGLAIVSAGLPAENNNDCYETHIPISILVMNGTADPISPFDGGEVTAGDGKNRGQVISTDKTIQYWLNNDSCSSTPALTYNFPDKDSTDNSTAIEYLYKSAITGKQVELVKIINGGHAFSNPGFLAWSGKMGNVNKDINSPRIIWDFFNNCK